MLGRKIRYPIVPPSARTAPIYLYGVTVGRWLVLPALRTLLCPSVICCCVLV